MSLPHASQQQIKAMQDIAEKKFGVIDESPVESTPIIEEQPVEYVEQEDVFIEAVDNDASTLEEQQPIKEKPDAKESFKAIRQAKEKAEQERDQLMRQVLEFQKQQLQLQQPKQQIIEQEEDELAELGIDADSLAEGKHLKKLIREIKSLKAEVSNYKKSSSETALEMKLRQQYPDFEKVATPQNLAALREADPDLADAIIATPDPLKQAALAYKMVKQYGIYKEDTFVEERVKVAQNASKPRPLTSLSPQQGETPLSKANAFANGLTKELREQMHKEMMAAMKGF